MELTKDHINKLQSSNDRREQTSTDNFRLVSEFKAAIVNKLSAMTQSVIDFKEGGQKDVSSAASLLGTFVIGLYLKAAALILIHWHMYLWLKCIGQNFFYTSSKRARLAKRDYIIAKIPRSLQPDHQEGKVSQKGDEKVRVGVVFSC